MAKKTEDQLFTEWQSKISNRQSFRESLPEYQELIQKLLSGEDATDKLKAFVENYGLINPLFISLEKIKLLEEASIGTSIPVLANDWIVKPMKRAGESPVIRGGGRGGRDKMNWDVYLDDKGLVRFAVRQNTPRQIKGDLKSWLEILKKNKVITFDPKGNPKVTIIGPLVSQEGPGIILSLNPFAKRERILSQVIQVLKKCPKFSFQRKDRLHPKRLSERIRAQKLWKEGKNCKEIAAELWPQEWQDWCSKESKLSNNEELTHREVRNLREQYALELIKNGKKKDEARKEATERFQIGKPPTSPLIIRVCRLINQAT